jgi:hypothetical protein
VRLDVAASTWRQTSTAAPRSESKLSFDEYLARYDAVLEALNPVTGKVIASKRIDAPLQRFFASDLTFTHRSDTDGYRYVDVWQMRLVGPSETTR